MQHLYFWRGCAALLLALPAAAVPAAAQTPTVSTLTPGRNAPAAPRTGNVTLTFSQAVDAATASNVQVFSTRAEGRKAMSYNSGANALVLVPARPFKAGEVIEVTVPATVTAGGVAVTPQVYQFTTNAAVAPATFSSGSEVSVGNSPRFLTTADVDGDGDLDLITADNPITTTNTQGTVSIRLNDGRGAFGGGSTITMNDAANFLSMADIDGDGDLDMLMTVPNQNEVRIRLNNGQGTFTAGSTIQMLYFPACVITADVDADGDQDLITAATSSSAVSVRLNNGSGSFASPTQSLSAGSPGSLVAADVDNDGDLDLLAANSLGSTVSMLVNNGHGSFSAASPVTVSGNVRQVLAADLDGDGDVDLTALGVNATNTGSTLSIRLNAGNNVFSASQDIGYTLASSASLADVDGDGDLDLLVTNRTALGELLITFNNGLGTFTNARSFRFGDNPSCLATADVDGDGDIDVLQTNGNFTGSVSVRLNGGTALATKSAQAAPLGVFPNPAQTQVRVQAPAGATQVALYDALGRLARTVPATAGAAPTLLPLAGLPTGVYLVRSGAAVARLVVE